MLGQQNDLAGVVVHVSYHPEDGYQDRAVAPGAGGLRVNNPEQARGRQRDDHRDERDAVQRKTPLLFGARRRRAVNKTFIIKILEV